MSRYGRRAGEVFLEGFIIVAMIAGAALGIFVFAWIVKIIVNALITAI